MVARTDSPAVRQGFLADNGDASPRRGERRFLTGIQALVRLLVIQRIRDRDAGLDTAGFVSGYRGSPLGRLDQALVAAQTELEAHAIRFTPGLNEDLAATAVWGSQQVGLFGKPRHDGVFGLWYAKGPGVDRSLDVLKHANAAGTGPHGGVLAIAGDDHGAKSSSLPHQSDHVFAAAMIPVLSPSGVQDILDLGVHGWAMSRFSGCWVALKATGDTVESSAAVDVDPHRVTSRLPEDFEMPPGGLSIRWPDPPLAQELRLQRYKVYAAMAYARANRLNRIVIDSPRPRLGIISTGKSYLDVCQALDDLGIDPAIAAEIGLRVLKIGMVWPLDAETVRRFAEGLQEVLVVEEKRQLMEYQLKEQLYNWRADVRPRVIGKYDEKGEWELPLHDWQLPAAGELTPAMIARVIAQRIARFHHSPQMQARLEFLDAKESSLERLPAALERRPHYCSGCPHNTSTRVPDGSDALAGIGCHYMATWIYGESTRTFSQMGGEGVAWIGQAPFTAREHVFANLGDGTYFHSGLLAIRAAVAAGVPITYKILFNDAVAMTGGQKMETAGLGPAAIAAQVRAEGVRRVVVVTDAPRRYHARTGLGRDIPVHDRRELDAVQRRLREYPGVSVLIYDQTCAAEKRRRRKRGLIPDPPRRVVINDRVCEGCGDCSRTSDCMSVIPLATEWGTKRQIEQSSCNKDFSCVEGFCPSFVTVEVGRLRRPAVTAPGEAVLPEPVLPPLDEPYGILVAGVGGTGVVTIAAILGEAASREGLGVTSLDMAGLAQKGGAVWSHVRLAARPERLYAARIAAGEAALVLGCDIVVTDSDESIAKMQAGLTRAVVNTGFSITSDMVRTQAEQAATGDLLAHPDPVFPLDAMRARIVEAVGADAAAFLDASALATTLLGDAIATNLLLVGFAWQKGLIPLRRESIERAIESNGAAVELNRAAFAWGRRAALDLEAVERAARALRDPPDWHRPSAGLDKVIARRRAELTTYQDEALAARYTALVERVRAAEARAVPGATALTEAVARFWFKLLAVKDEYEVARLYTDGAFEEQVRRMFEGDVRVCFHLAPPLLARRDPSTGAPRKLSLGPWFLPVLRGLARFRRLRGSAFDPFGWTAERRLERQLATDYAATIEQLLPGLGPTNHATAVAIASLPDAIRGYGHVKRRYLEAAERRRRELLERFTSAMAPAAAAPRPAVVAEPAG